MSQGEDLSPPANDPCTSACRGEGKIHYSDFCLANQENAKASALTTNGRRRDVHLISFANRDYIRSLRRLRRHAFFMGGFSSVTALTESDLPERFRQHFSEILNSNTRGFGYWSWKPEIIHNALEKLENGDLLVYLDAGCHLNARGRQRFANYLEWLCRGDNDILAFQYRPLATVPKRYPTEKISAITDIQFTKMEVKNYFDAAFQKETNLETGSIAAGIIMIEKSAKSSEVIKLWRETTWAKPGLLTDEHNPQIQHPDFIEPRHDQSLFSLILKEHGAETISAHETWIPKSHGKQPDWRPLGSYPILAKRDLKPSSFSAEARRRSRKNIGAKFDRIKTIFTNRTP